MAHCAIGSRITAAMPIQRTTLNVSLTTALEQFIAERVASGRYQTASEVVRAGLRLLEQTEAAHSTTTGDAPLSKIDLGRA
jgi:putative addiction module CopG family antidote